MICHNSPKTKRGCNHVSYKIHQMIILVICAYLALQEILRSNVDHFAPKLLGSLNGEIVVLDLLESVLGVQLYLRGWDDIRLYGIQQFTIKVLVTFSFFLIGKSWFTITAILHSQWNRFVGNCC